MLSNSSPLAAAWSLSGTAPSTSQINLSWAAPTGATGYSVERSADGSTGWTPIATVSGTTYSDTGLAAGTSYSYRVQATNGDSLAPYSYTATVTTLPDAPDGLTATAVSATRIDLSWSDHAANAYENFIEQSTDGVTWTQVGWVSGGVTTYSATGPFDGATTYEFRVRTYTYSGIYSDYSTPATVTTPAYPDRPTLSSATPQSATSVALTWTAAAGATGYRVERSGDGGSTWATAGTVAAGVTTFTDTGLNEATSYTYRVFATDDVGDSAPSANLTAATPPSAPTGLSATVVSGGQVNLSWTNHSASAAYYYVEQSPNGSTGWVQIASLYGSGTNSDIATGPFNGSTAYYFRVRAWAYTGGYSDYTATSATTPAFPNQPTLNSVTAASDTSVSLAWTDVAGETGFTVERSANGGSTWTTAGTTAAGVTTFTDTGLAESTAYTYRLFATNAAGTSASSPTRAVTTLPSAPSDLSATAVSATQINLTWTDHSASGYYYYVEQSTDGMTWTQIGSIYGSTANSYTATGPFNGSTTYDFRVRVYSYSGLYSAYAPTATVTTAAYPSRPTINSATAQSDTSIALAWQDVANETGFRVERLVGSTWTAVGTVGAGVTTFTDTGLHEGTSYSYHVVATNAAGDSAPSATLSAVTILSAPTDLSATPVSGSTINLSWTNHSTAASTNYVEQSTDGVTWTQIASVPAGTSSFTATGPFSRLTSYSFRVRAYTFSYVTYTALYSSYATTSATTPAYPYTPALNWIVPQSSTSVALSWTDAPGEAGFRVERSTDNGSTWTTAGTVGAGVTTFTDSGLAEATSYTYRVVATNAAGDSIPSETQAVVTQPTAPSGLTAVVVSGGQINLSWTDHSSAATSYLVEQSPDGSTGWVTVGSFSGSGATSGTVIGPFNGATTYYFRVRDYAAPGGYSAYATASATTPPFPNQPALSAVTVQSDTAVSLTWTDVLGETGFRVERLESGTWTALASVASGVTTYSDTGLHESTLYSYRVVATDAAGESAPSAAVNAITAPTAPTGLEVNPISGSRIELSWTNLSTTTQTIYVEESPDGSTGWHQVGTVGGTATSFSVVDSFIASTAYFFRVRGYAYSGGYSSYVTATATTPAFPNAPTGVMARPASETSITVTWSDVAGEDGFRVERSTGTNGPWTAVGTVGAGVTTFTDTGLAGSTRYTYRVIASNAAGDSTYSNTASTLLSRSVDNDDTYTAFHDRTLTVTPLGGVLANDTAASGDPLTAVLITDVGHGTLILNPDGSFAYTPEAGYSGTDSFTYQASDGLLTGNVSTVTITVTERAPVAGDDLYQAVHDRTLSTTAADGVLANDADADADPLTASLIAGPAHGTLTLNPDGSFLYTPAAGYSGSDSFTYQASDGQLTSNVATATLNVAESAPVAVDDDYDITHDGVLTATAADGVLANDADADGDALTVSLVSGPTNGTLTLNPDGSFVYTPVAGYSGTDSFTYQVGDGLSSATASVTVAVDESAPVAVDDAYTTAHDQALTSDAMSGVLANDSDSDGDPLTVSMVSGTANGTLVLNPDGTFTYTPDAGYSGADEFTYQVSDGLLSATANVVITISESAPIATADAYSTPHDQAVTVDASGGVLANDADADGETLTASLVTGVAHGTLTLNPDGSFVYTPEPGYSGTDQFTYEADDGLLASTATATITVTESAPVANDDTYTIGHGRSLTVTSISRANGVQANDSDADGDTLTTTLVTGVQHGTLTLNPDGTFLYTPDAGYSGTDGFTVQESDGLLSSGVSSVTITVTEAAPAASADRYGTQVGQPLTVTAAAGVLANDSDTDGDPLTATLVTGPAHGTLALASDGSFTYTPEAGFSGSGSFTYTVNDGLLTSAAATVTIDVGEAAPAAADDRYSIGHDRALTVTAATGVLANDSDPEGDPITASLVSGPAHGTLTLYADGSFIYAPAPGYSGTDSFTYQAGDGSAASASAIVSLTVTESAPVAVADATSIGHDQTLTVTAASGVLVNDSDPDNDPLEASLVSTVRHGTLTLNGDGSFTYTPDAHYAGFDSFTYSVGDGQLSSTATVAIDVTEEAPLVFPASYGVHPGTPLTTTAATGVLAGDTDAEGDPMTATLVTGPAHGTLTLAADGSFTYTPAAGFSGNDSFTYTASDGLLSSEDATVTLDVSSPAPAAADDSYSIGHDQALTATAATGVLANDSDGVGYPLTASLVTGPAHGTLTLAADGSFTYTPNAHYVGLDSFTYSASDGQLSINGVTTIDVTERAPAAAPDAYSVEHGQSLAATESVLTNDADLDGDVLTPTLIADVSHGTLIFDADGTFTYTPDSGFVGTDSFTYQDSDGIHDSNAVTVSLTVTDAAPAGVADHYEVGHDLALTTTAATGVLANDHDASGDALDAGPIALPAHGTLILAADGSFTYTPDAHYAGPDSFTYAPSDGVLTGAPVTVTLTVTDNAPAAHPDSYRMSPGNTLTTLLSAPGPLGVLANDTDADADALTATLVTNVQHGTLTLNGDGTFSYTPTAGYTGADSFSYEVSDGVLTATAVASISVSSAAPTAGDDADSVTPGQVLHVDAPGLLANDVDPAGRPLSASLVAGPTHGTLSLNPDGSFVYVPTSGYTGTDQFTYKASDGPHDSNIATVTLDVGTIVVRGAATPVSATEGTAVSGTVATFGDATTGQPAGSYTAIIDWGDGSNPTVGTVRVSGTAFLVAGIHTYMATGTFAGTVTVTGASGAPGLGRFTASVAAAHLSVHSIPFSATTAASRSVTLASFTGHPGETAGNFTATIDWGDGNTSTGTITTQADGSFAVSSDHAFAASGPQSVQVEVIDNATGESMTGADTAYVGPADGGTGEVGGAGGGQGFELSATEAEELVGRVASFVLDDPADDPAADYTATIDWGDGNVTEGEIDPFDEGGFDVSGSHTYAVAGGYSVVVSVEGSDGTEASAASFVQVGPAHLGVYPYPISPAAEHDFDGVVASLVYHNTDATAGEFAAMIDWGDGTTTPGEVVAHENTSGDGGDTSGDNGPAPDSVEFDILGDHRYESEGTYTLTVQATQQDGGTASGHVDINVGPGGAVIDNGTIRLGVNAEGDLNYGSYGLYDISTHNEVVDIAYLGEGWGLADTNSGVTGYANVGGGTSNVNVVSFKADDSTATTVVDIGTTLRMTNVFHPADGTDSVYEIDVTVENLTDSEANLRYRRVMDWDVEPTAFDEYVTNSTGGSSAVIFDSNDGFASADPLFAESSLGHTGDFGFEGPSDQGALFDFALGALDPHEVKTFKIFYGADASSSQAQSDLSGVGAQAYSMAEPANHGTNTFFFGFKDGDTQGGPKLITSTETGDATDYVSAEDPEAFVEAAVSVGTDASGEPIYAGDGTEVKWTVVGSDGAIHEEKTTTTTNGQTSVTLDTTDVPGDAFKVFGQIVKLVENGGEIAFEGPEVEAGEIVVVPGLPNQLNLNVVETLPADGTSTTEVTLTVTDAQGNPVADGTPVDWDVAGPGTLLAGGEVTTNQGKATVRIKAGVDAGDLAIVATVNGQTAQADVQMLPLVIQLGITGNVITLGTGDSARVTARVTDTNGNPVADGTPISWFLQKGGISSKDQTVTGGVAYLDISGMGGSQRPGKGTIRASVGGSQAAISYLWVVSSTQMNAQIDHPVLSGDSSVDSTFPIAQADGTVTPYHVSASGEIQITNGTPFAQVKIQVGGGPLTTGSALLQVVGPDTITLDAQGRGRFRVQSTGVLPSDKATVIPVTIQVVQSWWERLFSGPAPSTTVNVGLMPKELIARTTDMIKNVGWALLTGEADTPEGMAADFLLGVSPLGIIADARDLGKQFLNFFTGKPVSILAIGLSLFGMVTFAFPPANWMGDVMKQLAKRVDASKWVWNGLMDLAKAGKVSDLMNLQPLLVKLITPDGLKLLRLAESTLLKSTDDLLELGRIVSKFGDQGVSVLVNAATGIRKDAARRVMKMLGKMDDATAATLQKLGKLDVVSKGVANADDWSDAAVRKYAKTVEAADPDVVKIFDDFVEVPGSGRLLTSAEQGLADADGAVQGVLKAADHFKGETVVKFQDKIVLNGKTGDIDFVTKTRAFEVKAGNPKNLTKDPKDILKFEGQLERLKKYSVDNGGLTPVVAFKKDLWVPANDVDNAFQKISDAAAKFGVTIDFY